MIQFLVKKVLDENGVQKPEVKTDKSLLIHSLEVSFYLKNLAYDNKIVIAGLLHDLLEDTDTTKKEIQSLFGTKIADIIEALSFDFGYPKGADYKESYEKMANFKEALIIRAADIWENLKYFEFTPRKEKSKLLQKWLYFLKVARRISNEPVYKNLKRKVEDLI